LSCAYPRPIEKHWPLSGTRFISFVREGFNVTLQREATNVSRGVERGSTRA
jgi:hypothetical protein